MKSIKNITACALAAFGASLAASAADVVMVSPAEYQVISISPNGKWACGVYVDYSQSYYGFRWDLESGTTELLSSSTESTAYCIANDGTVAGTYFDANVVSGEKVEMPGFYKNGEWHAVELPAGTITDGMGYGISSDGQYMSGSIHVNGTYTGFIWKNGQIYKELSPKGKGFDCMPYTISPDGQSAAGWCYMNGRSQRVAVIWNEGNSATAISDYESPWSSGRKFTADGKSLLYWGGFTTHDDGHLTLKGVYDIASGQTTEFYAGIDNHCNVDVYDISNNNTVVGKAYELAYVFTADTAVTFQKYMEDLNVDLSVCNPLVLEDGTTYGFTCTFAISPDENIMAAYYIDAEGNTRTVLVKRGVDSSALPPAGVAASQVYGINAACITWHQAQGAEGVKGYNIYRDNVKLNSELLNQFSFYDKGLDYDKPYTYTVSAIQADGKENMSDAATVTLAKKQISKPMNLLGRQKGLNSVLLSWDTPSSNFFPKGYFVDGSINGFGSNNPNSTFEIAISFDGDEIACYEGCKIGKFSFVPMEVAKGWAVNFYTRDNDGKLQLIQSKPITQELNYRQRNTVVLDNPVTVPANGIIAALEITIGDATGNVVGMSYGTAVPGYSDLLRQKGEEDFYSLFEVSSAVGTAMQLRWQMEIVLMPGDADLSADEIQHYAILSNGTQVATTSDLSTLLTSVAAGNYTYGVKAVYKNNTESAAVETALNVTNNYEPISKVELQYAGNDANFSWEAPVDNDPTYVTYANGQVNSIQPSVPESVSNFLASVIFTPEKLQSYDGYSIQSLTFYPYVNALYTLILVEDGVQIAEIEVEDTTTMALVTVPLSEPITIKKNSTYQLIVDCFDIVGGYILALDNSVSEALVSDLYSFGDGWSSIKGDVGVNGNWIMGMNIVDPEGQPVPVNGYNIRVDNTQANAELLTDTHFTYDVAKLNEILPRHSVAVDVQYTALPSITRGTNVYFLYSSSVADGVMAEVNLQVGDNYLKVTGEDVQQVSAYAVSGVKVASVDGDTLPISHLAPGVYVITVKTAAGTISRKLKINK